MASSRAEKIHADEQKEMMKLKNLFDSLLLKCSKGSGVMELGAVIEDYLMVHALENHSHWTISHTRERLFWFADWLDSTYGITDTDGLLVLHLRAWVGHLQQRPSLKTGKKLSDQTIYTYGETLLKFCHWLEREEVLAKPITTKFKLPRVEQKYIPTFTSEDVERLMTACEAGTRYTPSMRRALTARNRAILSVLIDTGVRRSELVGLRLVDVDRDMRVLTVHRKGNRWQQVPITYDGFKALHEYLAKHRAVLAALDGRTVTRKDDAVFLADDGKRLTIRGVSKLFERLHKRTGIEGKRVSPHQCRRYMATTQLASGRSPLDVQRQMGHSTLKMTNHYASFNIQQLKRSHEMHSPLRAKQDSSGSHEGGSAYWEEE
jgi:site-specific recombinase XerD